MVEVSFTWRGDEVKSAVMDACVDAMNEAGRQGESMLRSLTPVKTGFLRDSSYVVVDVSGNSPVLIIGQSANYALFIELGTRFVTGHYQLTQTGQYIFPLLTSLIASAIGQRGYGASGQRGSAGAGVPNPYLPGGPLSSLHSQAVQQAPLVPAGR